MESITDTILVTDAENLGFKCGGGYAVYLQATIFVDGQPDGPDHSKDICVANGLTYEQASTIANEIERLNPHMGQTIL